MRNLKKKKIVLLFLMFNLFIFNLASYNMCIEDDGEICVDQKYLTCCNPLDYDDKVRHIFSKHNIFVCSGISQMAI